MHVVRAIAEASGLVEAVGLLSIAGTDGVHHRAIGNITPSDISVVVGASVELVAALLGLLGVAETVCSIAFQKNIG